MKRPLIAMFNMMDGEEYLKVSVDYLDALWNSGALGAPVAYINDSGYIQDITMEFDGFIFCGGGDISPTYYGENTHPKTKNICSLRDECELTVFNKVYRESNKPILGICRGLQIMNVALGGTLIQHIENHSQTTERRKCEQIVNLTTGGFLQELLRADTILTNSFHHQAIGTLASDLMVDALADDGTIEAVHSPQKRFCLGIQWHPENFYRYDKNSKMIFDAFVDACRSPL